ncbi:hypothetical protein V8V91_15575 [Algoriphagus halophilus]|uniref:hypothetical protein n=1 Tax=Algoriphagus halophilus TaxID=226505 RepID=UPI00358EDC29
MIQQGKKVSEAASISTKKNEFSWLRQDIPSLPDEPFVGNLINYQERVDGYLYSSEYVNPDKLEESEMVYANWNQLANRWLDLEDVTPYFNLAPEEIKDYPVFQIDSLTKLNQAKALYDFASQEIELLSSSWLEPIYPLDKLLIEKKGNSFDKNMLLLHLLRKQGINANLVMVNDKYIGRKRLIEVPFINQFGSSVISAEIEGKNYLLDASDSIVPFGLLPLEKLVDQGFVLERGKGRLEKLHHQFRSGSIQTVKLDKNDSLGFVLKNQIRLTDHEAIKIGKAIRSFNGEGSIFENVSRFKNLDLNEINIDNQLKEKRAVTLSFDSKIEDSNGELVFIYPFQFSEFFKNPFTQESRLLPVEFQFPFFENLNSTISIPLGYELEDYPESISITIPSKSVKFSYLVNLAENELKIATKLDVTSEYFSVSEYPDLKYIFEELANHLNTPVVLKKITKP